MPAELLQARGEILFSVIKKSINCLWNKEDLLDQWLESIIVPVHKQFYETDLNNYCDISLPTNSYKSLSSILPSMLSPYSHEITGNCQ
jgi:hypothetical protein